MKIIYISMLYFLLGINSVISALPDPTRPPNGFTTSVIERETPRQRDEFHVNAIRVSDEDRSAIVNGQIVRVGETIGPATVREINLQEVLLEYRARIISVPLFTGTINKIYKTSVEED